MTSNTPCPTCGQPLPADAPMGICPNCLIDAGFGTMTNPPEGAKLRAFEPPPPERLAPHFPQLEILELLGRGGMGAVYKVRQKRLDRLVALKILPPGIGEDAAFAERFEREAKALAKLHHPHIVTLYEFGEVDGFYYFLMEFVDGVTLRQLLSGGRLAPAEAVAIVPQICEALQFAHDRGIVHRDIKPENILLGKDGLVKIADFGVAKIVAGSAGEPEGAMAGVAAGGAETQAEGIIGTPAYMAPEQIAHPREVDHRADIYALGVVFYQMLTGELPGARFEAPSRKVHIDVRLDEVVLRALAEEPARRYQQAEVMKTQVETIAHTSAGDALAGGRRTDEPERRRASAPVTAWRTYAMALAKVLPLLAIWWLCAMFLAPKLQALLAESSVALGKLQAMAMFVLAVLRVESLWVLLGLVGLIALAEWLLPAWRQYRRRGLQVVTTVLNAIALVGLLSLATLALGFASSQGARFSASPSSTSVIRKPSSPPFAARYAEGTVELAAVSYHPSAGKALWRPDGTPSEDRVPEETGKSMAAGKEMRELIFRLQSTTGNASSPIVRFAASSDCVAMGSSTYPATGDQATISVNTIGCPPDHVQASFRVGIADGPWETIITLPIGSELNGHTQIGAQDGTWEASVSSVATPGTENVAVAYHYSVRQGWETELAVRTADGVSRMKSGTVRSSGELAHSMTTLTREEVAKIEAVELRRRGYRWMEFHNVALHPGAKTEVEVVDAPH